MAVLVLAMLMLAMTGQASCTWCVCKDLSVAILQTTLDYACGAGADCNPTHKNGPCFQPDTVRSHCSYAVNSYYQKKGQAPGSCDFSGTATISTSDPSVSGCSYPATVSAANTGSTTGTTTTPSSTTPVNPTPTTNTPGTTIGNPSTTSPGTTTSPYTPSSNGMLGGFGNGGVGPSGSGMNTDMSDACSRLQNMGRAFSFLTVVLMLLWG